MSFRLTSNDVNFNDRVNSLFDSLESASKVCEKLPDDKVIQKEEYKSDKLLNNSTDFCFKKPFRPKLVISQKQESRSMLKKHGKCLPDYVKNPEKWTCYSLADTECNTDAQNKIIGTELMLGLKQGNDLPYQVENKINKLSSEVVVEKIEFSKNSRSNIDASQSINSGCTAVRKSSEHFILPNYEIGKIKNKSKKFLKKNQSSVKDKTEKSKQLILSHLCEEEYEDDTGI